MNIDMQQEFVQPPRGWEVASADETGQAATLFIYDANGEQFSLDVQTEQIARTADGDAEPAAPVLAWSQTQIDPHQVGRVVTQNIGKFVGLLVHQDKE